MTGRHGRDKKVNRGGRPQGGEAPPGRRGGALARAAARNRPRHVCPVDDMRGLLKAGARIDMSPRVGAAGRDHKLLAEVLALLSADAAISVTVRGVENLRRAAKAPSRANSATLRVVGSPVHRGVSRRAALLAFDRYVQRLQPDDPAMARLLARIADLRADRTNHLPRGPTSLAAHRSLLADDSTWRSSGFFASVCQPAGVADAVYSACVRPDGEVALVVAFRGNGAAPFELRDALILRLIHSHAEWLHKGVSRRPPPAPVRLTARQQQTLQALLTGQSEKQIALMLGRSQHTVHTYVKSIYKAYGVSSRAELLARFLSNKNA
jgi:DNA-binding CsgD family transcriptional regulator